jgi:hypothetical protein
VAATASFPRRRRFAKLALLQLVLWPLALLGAEFGWRGVRALQSRTFSAESARTELLQLQSRNRDFVPRPNNDLPWNEAESAKAERVLHPYVGFDIVGGLEMLEDQRVSFRADDPKKTFRLAIFGGSVAQMFSQSAAERLRQIVMETPRLANADVQVLSFARGGFRQPQMQAFLAYLLSLGVVPDAVVCLDGFNEVAIGVQNVSLGTHPSFPSVPHWAKLLARGTDTPEAIEVAAGIRGAQRELDELLEWTLDHGVERSVIATEYVLWRGRKLRRSYLAGFERYTQILRSSQVRRVLSGPALKQDFADPVASSVAIWREASRNMRALCDARRIPYLHVLQPTLHDPGAKPIHPNELRDGAIDERWLFGVEHGYPALRVAGAELANEGEHFYDATRLFEHDAEPIYFDACHLNNRGNARLAEEIGRRLLELVR